MNAYTNLTIIPYSADYAECAARTRAEILQRKGSDFIVAVDLPQGLEEEIQKAVRSLPKPSLIIDALKRGILITPTSAPVEAVRSYLEYGYEMHCIDASLPVSGNFSEYEYFIRMCKIHGPQNVIEKSEQYGISREELFHAWAHTALGSASSAPGFFSLPQRFSPDDCPPFDPASCSPYLTTRFQCMAMHLQKLLQSGLDVVFVCSRANVSGVLHYLSTDLPSFDDSYRLPVKVCNVPEHIFYTLTREIPYITYAYELYRDTPFDREQWIRHLYTENCGAVSAQQLTRTIEYAFRLALTDQQVFPDLYNLTASAKYMTGDSYGLKIYEKAISYPPAKGLESTCAFRSVTDYNFNPMSEGRVLKLRSEVLDKPLPPVNPRSKKNWSSTWYCRWTRTRKSQQAELELMKYLGSHFSSSTLSECESMAVAFTCGLKNGIDCRQTIRYYHEGRVFVKEPLPENDSCYILDYRPTEREPKNTTVGGGRFRIVLVNDSAEGYPTHIFCDKHYPWIGLAHQTGHHFDARVMVAFTSLPFSPTKIFDQIHSSNPLPSSVALGMKYARQVFVFTDRPGDLRNAPCPPGNVKIFPVRVLPPSIREKMRTWDITGYRHDNKPGD